MNAYPLVYDNGHVEYTKLGTAHRVRGPAIIWYDGTIVYERWGYRHRTTGPAVIDGKGNVSYCVNGKELTPEEFFMKYGVL